MICPCKECPDKGCGSYHDQCGKYQEWMSEQRIIKEKKKNDSIYNHFRKDMIHKTMKNSR